MNIRQNHQ